MDYLRHRIQQLIAANVDDVKKLSRLPETAHELRAIAGSLGADESATYLREAATETQVKSLDLSETGVVVFATYGLISGDLEGMAEPSSLRIISQSKSTNPLKRPTGVSFSPQSSSNTQRSTRISCDWQGCR